MFLFSYYYLRYPFHTRRPSCYSTVSFSLLLLLLLRNNGRPYSFVFFFPIFLNLGLPSLMEDVDVNKETHRALLVIILFPSDSLLTLYPITFTPNFLKLWTMMWNLCLLKSEKCRHFRLVIRSILNFSKCDYVQNYL